MNVLAKGIDVSYCQTSVDYKTVKKNGISFVMIKLGNAKNTGLTIDPLFDKHYRDATAAGLNIGVYVYAYCTTTANATKCALQTISALKTRKCVLTYPVAFDMEFEPAYIKSTSLAAANTAINIAFLDQIKKSGYMPMIYTCPGMAASFLNMDKLTKYECWVAQYSIKLTFKYPCGIWQYNVAGDAHWDLFKMKSVPGVSGTCDCDYVYKDYPTIIKKSGYNGFTNTTPAPTTKSAVIKYAATLRASAGASSAKITLVPAGGKVTVYTGSNTKNVCDGLEWIKVVYNGRTGWIVNTAI